MTQVKLHLIFLRRLCGHDSCTQTNKNDQQTCRRRIFFFRFFRALNLRSYKNDAIYVVSAIARTVCARCEHGDSAKAIELRSFDNLLAFRFG